MKTNRLFPSRSRCREARPIVMTNVQCPIDRLSVESWSDDQWSLAIQLAEIKTTRSSIIPDGARTFLSAATAEWKTVAELHRGSRTHVAADRNVRAPLVGRPSAISRYFCFSLILLAAVLTGCHTQETKTEAG